MRTTTKRARYHFQKLGINQPKNTPAKTTLCTKKIVFARTISQYFNRRSFVMYAMIQCKNKDMRRVHTSLCYISAVISTAVMLMLKENMLLTTIMIAALSIFLMAMHRQKTYLIFAFVMFLIGASVEIAAVRSNTWMYPIEDIFGIPLWIPFLWINGAFGVLALRQSIARYFSERS